MRTLRTLCTVLLLAIAAVSSASEPPRWGVLQVLADAPYDALAWREAVNLEGRALDEAPLEPALWRGLRALADAGYAFAEVHPGEFDLEDGRVNGVLRLSPGPRARLVGLVLAGAKVTRPGTAYRMSGLAKDQV